MSEDVSFELEITEVRKYEIPVGHVGRAEIFNYEKFTTGFLRRTETRFGTGKDKRRLNKVLKNIGFQVNIHNNLTKAETKESIKETSRSDFDRDSCFLAVFLSHGKENKLETKNGKLDILKDILQPFRSHKCEALAKKPKIFLIQSCRGKPNKKKTFDFDTSADARGFKEVSLPNTEISVVPAGANFLVCYATDTGNCAFRHQSHGSWFIQTFVEVVKHFLKPLVNSEDSDEKEGSNKIENHYPSPSMDFLSLMTLVADNVAKKACVDQKNKIYLQVPCVVSTLRKKLLFPKFCVEAPAQQSQTGHSSGQQTQTIQPVSQPVDNTSSDEEELA